jgi:hypothetical protein
MIGQLTEKLAQLKSIVLHKGIISSILCLVDLKIDSISFYLQYHVRNTKGT